MSALILTIDLGTSGPKVALFDSKGKCIGYEFQEVPLLLYEGEAQSKNLRTGQMQLRVVTRN